MTIWELNSKTITNKEHLEVRISVEAMLRKTRNSETICSHIGCP